GEKRREGGGSGRSSCAGSKVSLGSATIRGKSGLTLPLSFSPIGVILGRQGVGEQTTSTITLRSWRECYKRSPRDTPPSPARCLPGIMQPGGKEGPPFCTDRRHNCFRPG